MSPNTTKQSKERVYTLCRVCNLKGKNGNPLVTCMLCTQKMHSKNSCARVSDNNSTKFICSLCKTINRRSIQSRTVFGRRSTPHIATPTTTMPLHTKGRNTGRNSILLSPACNTVLSGCDVVSHSHLEKELQRLDQSLNELRILHENSNTIINSLKKENQRLSAAVNDLQRISHSSKLPTGTLQWSSIGSEHHSSHSSHSTMQESNNNYLYKIDNSNNTNMNFNNINNKFNTPDYHHNNYIKHNKYVNTNTTNNNNHITKI